VKRSRQRASAAGSNPREMWPAGAAVRRGKHLGRGAEGRHRRMVGGTAVRPRSGWSAPRSSFRHLQAPSGIVSIAPRRRASSQPCSTSCSTSTTGTTETNSPGRSSNGSRPGTTRPAGSPRSPCAVPRGSRLNTRPTPRSRHEHLDRRETAPYDRRTAPRATSAVSTHPTLRPFTGRPDPTTNPSVKAGEGELTFPR
jgi:hypothetical protein